MLVPGWRVQEVVTFCVYRIDSKQIEQDFICPGGHYKCIKPEGFCSAVNICGIKHKANVIVECEGWKVCQQYTN